MQQKQSREQVVIEHIKKLTNIVHPGESMRKVFERYDIDWTTSLVSHLDFDFKTWVYLWDKLCVTEQKRADAWIVLIAEKEAENSEATK